MRDQMTGEQTIAIGKKIGILQLFPELKVLIKSKLSLAAGKDNLCGELHWLGISSLFWYWQSEAMAEIESSGASKSDGYCGVTCRFHQWNYQYTRYTYLEICFYHIKILNSRP